MKEAEGCFSFCHNVVRIIIVKVCILLLHYLGVEFINMSLWLNVFHVMDLRIEQSCWMKGDRDEKKVFLSSLLQPPLLPPPCFDCAFNTLYVCPPFFPSPHFSFKMSHLFILSQTWVWRPLFCFLSTCESACKCVCVYVCVCSFFLWKKNVMF